MTLTSTLRASLSAVQSAASDFGSPTFTPQMTAALSLSDGVLVDQANILFMDDGTIASGASDAIDLSGVLANAFGATISAVEIVAIFLINKPAAGGANTTNLTIGGGTNPVVGYLGGTTPTIGPIRPGGFIMLASPDVAGLCAVTAGTGDILTVTNSAGASATYQIGIVARNA